MDVEWDPRQDEQNIAMRAPDRIRLISARKANDRETKQFRQQTIPTESPSTDADES